MSKAINEIFVNSLFEYGSCTCHCEKDIENTAPGQPARITLKLCSQPKEALYFSYASQKGLNLSGNSGGIIAENILGKLLAIPTGDVSALINFFETYGFLFPISSTEYESVDALELNEIVNRIKATIHLMGAIAGQKDYKRILILTAYLLYSQPITMQLSTLQYSTCQHLFTTMLEQYDSFPDLSRNQEVFSTKKYSVPDTLYASPYKIDIDFFNHVRSGDDTSLPGSNTPWFKHLFALYTGYHNCDNNLRTIIDFFYHYQCEVGVIKEVSIGGIKYCGKANRENFTDEMKAALLKIANIVIGEEINSNLYGICPQYNIGTLTPAWKLTSLLQAICFSVFYMKPGVELYKQCKNPNCKRDVFFLIKTTATNKSYCCPACANAAAQQRSRQRKLEKK